MFIIWLMKKMLNSIFFWLFWFLVFCLFGIFIIEFNMFLCILLIFVGMLPIMIIGVKLFYNECLEEMGDLR